LDAKAEEEIINKRQARNMRKRGNSRKSVTEKGSSRALKDVWK